MKNSLDSHTERWKCRFRPSGRGRPQHLLSEVGDLGGSLPAKGAGMKRPAHLGSVAGAEYCGEVVVAKVRGSLVDPGVDFGFCSKCDVKLSWFWVGA